MPKIHTSAVVEAGAQLADDVVVGAFAYVGPHVVLGKGCVLHHHASIEGYTVVGEANEFFPYSLIGAAPQDLKYKGGECRVIIGNNNQFREMSTVHIGTEDGGGFTRIGDGNLFMVGAHIAHDCIIGNHCILANNVLLAGHVELEDYVIISGACAAHHYTRFGQHAFVGGMTPVTRDIPPFMIADGNPVMIRGVNRTGLKRRGFTDEQLDRLKNAWRLLFKDTTPWITQAPELERLYPDATEIKTLLQFMHDSMSGKYGRARENLRGKQQWQPQQNGE